jgi:hypothetical protein
MIFPERVFGSSREDDVRRLRDRADHVRDVLAQHLEHLDRALFAAAQAVHLALRVGAALREVVPGREAERDLQLPRPCSPAPGSARRTPSSPEAWRWYREHIGGDRTLVVGTWWQTETGMILITPLPG